MPNVIMKKCNTCGRSKPLADFYTSKITKDGYRYNCKYCCKIYSASRDCKRYDYNKYRVKYEADPQKFIRPVLDCAKKYPEKFAARSALRHARKLQRTPAWLTVEQKAEIATFYALATSKTKETGIKHEVDHIIPLKGKDVSGLHVPWNLQVLTQIDNRRKTNRHG